MLTLKEARKIQNEREIQAIIKFLISVVFISIIFILIFVYTDILSLNKVFYLLPAPFIFVAAKASGFFNLFTQKEFVGEVRSIHVYRITERVSKGVGSGHGGSGGTHFEAELIVFDKNGKSVIKTFWCGDVVSNLSEGDEIAIMRFLDEPILIKGKYWTSNG